MKKFRKKPVVVEAYQWHKNMGESEGVYQNPNSNPMLVGTYYVRTVNGYVPIQDNEWIIRGVKGEFYPCKPDIFEQTYEEVK